VRTSVGLSFPAAETAALACDHPFLERPRRAGQRGVTIMLEPDELVGLTVVGMQNDRVPDGQ